MIKACGTYDLTVDNRVLIPWRPVTPLELVNGAMAAQLATVDSHRAAWEDFVTTVSREDFDEARRRSLRRHAIETGIIERLYDVDWGVTEALVAEGLVGDVAEGEGGIDSDALSAISSQFEALEFLASEAHDGRDLTVGLIKEVHVAITRHQGHAGK
ncbi:MAG: hypothetical protein ACRDTD_19825 [Pseudonocardiaceae bacterium]